MVKCFDLLSSELVQYFPTSGIQVFLQNSRVENQLSAEMVVFDKS